MFCISNDEQNYLWTQMLVFYSIKPEREVKIKWLENKLAAVIDLPVHILAPEVIKLFSCSTQLSMKF